MGAHLRRRVRDESGFTLIEAVVALMVLSAIFTAMAYAATGTLRASMVSRVEQQAIDFATQALESSRAVEFDKLANVATDMVGDTRVQPCGTVLTCFDPGTGAEPLVLETWGTATPHIKPVDRQLANGATMTLATYVTQPEDATAEYKRLTVIAQWTVGGALRERSISSLITLTDRGLPLPIFKLTPLGGTSMSINPGASAPFGFELTNQGAPDRWNLAFTGAGASEWALYRDDGDGIWKQSLDSLLTNTNPTADSLPDTGRIDPTASVVLWAVRPTSSTAPAGDYWSKLTATSVAQPLAVSGKASVDLLVRVESGSVVINPGSGQQDVAPSAPQYLQITTGDNELTASWQAPINAGSAAITDYVVRVKEAGCTDGDCWTTIDEGVSAATSATISGLANGTVYDVSVAAKNAANLTGPTVVAQGQPVDGTEYLKPTTCPVLLPTGRKAANNFTLRQYSLHNRSAANPNWPTVGSISSTSTVGQGLPLSAAVDGPGVPTSTNLPVYSSDIDAAEPGRILLAGGSGFLSNDTERVVDWRSTAGAKAYKGDVLLNLWVAPLLADFDPESALAELEQDLEFRAQLYIRGADGVLRPEGSDVQVVLGGGTFGPGPGDCRGWQQVWVKFDVNQPNLLGINEFIGVRMWNSASPTDPDSLGAFRVAYDVMGDFPAFLEVPEKP
jgi:type II secretory pathway pseudopilin PulG